jgi:hypothetical protein
MSITTFGKLDRRFSTLLAGIDPLPESNDSRLSIVAPSLSSKASSRLKRFLSSLLPTTPPTSEKLLTTSDVITQRLLNRGYDDIPTPKSTKKRPQTGKDNKRLGNSKTKSKGPVVVLPPTSNALVNPALPTRHRGKFARAFRGGDDGSRDSKFSSISSLASLQSISKFGLSVSPINITYQQFSQLRSLNRRLKRSLLKQAYLTEHLSINFEHLLTRKEKQVMQLYTMRRIRLHDREAMLRGLFLGKEHASKIFLRKAILLQHSHGVLAQLGELIELNAYPTDEKSGLIEMRVSAETIQDFLAKLQIDIVGQRQMNGELEKMVKRGCANKAFLLNLTERIITERFNQFVTERLVILNASYENYGSIVRQLGALQRTLGTLGLIS